MRPSDPGTRCDQPPLIGTIVSVDDDEKANCKALALQLIADAKAKGHKFIRAIYSSPESRALVVRTASIIASCQPAAYAPPDEALTSAAKLADILSEEIVKAWQDKTFDLSSEQLNVYERSGKIFETDDLLKEYVRALALVLAPVYR